MNNNQPIKMLNTSLLYYLSHPYTSFGDPILNISESVKRQIDIVNLMDIKIINPIVLLPLGLCEEIAMDKCRSLYEACEAIILCPGWNKSKGCKEEYWWAKNDGKPIYIYDDQYLKICEPEA